MRKKILVQNKAREKEKIKHQKVDTNRNHTIRNESKHMSNYTNCKYNESLRKSSSHQGRVNKVEENQGKKDCFFRRQTLKLCIRILKVRCLFLMKSFSNSVLPSISKRREVRLKVSAVISRRGKKKKSQVGAMEVILNSSYFLKAYTFSLHVVNF